MVDVCSVAPGAYQTEKVVVKQTPSYSFGVKVNHTKVSDTPCKYNSFMCCSYVSNGF